jgi:competence protein ComEC
VKAARSPAAVPALVFLLAVFAEGELLPSPVALLAIGGALALALQGRTRLRFAALFLGLLTARLAPPESLPGLDRSRPVEAVGSIAGDARSDTGGASVPLSLGLVRQGSRIWTAAPEVRLEVGERFPLPPEGSRVRLRGYLVRSPGFANARTVPPGNLRLRVKSATFMTVERAPSRAMRAVGRLRSAVGRPLAASAGRHPGVGYARAMLLGELDSVSARERLGFRRSGLAHLLAVSGMNVALVAAVAAALGSFCRRRVRLGLVAAAVLLHLALVGPVPSLLRATLMTSAALLGLLLERRSLALQSLAIAAILMVALEPALVRDLGFCLSCSATFGLVVLAPFILRGWERRRHPLAVALAVSLAAQAATLPWALAAFSYISPAAPLLNLIAVPLAGVLLVGALGWIVVALLVPMAGDLAALPLDLLAAPFRLLPELPTGRWLCLPLPPSWALGLALAALAIVAASSVRAVRIAIVVTLALGSAPRAPAQVAREIEWTLADVGQGDGTLLRRGGAAMLLDGGGSSSPSRARDYAAQIWLPIFAARGISRLDVAVVSHGDSDHCGGLVDVASYIPIGELWAPAEAAGLGCVREILALSRAGFRALAAGDEPAFADLRFAVLGPGRGFTGKDNDGSLVLALPVEGRRILFTGDIERRGEAELLARYPLELGADLLKVAHHGSATSSEADFLAAVGPRLALISAGVGNPFGHPAGAVTRRLRGSGSSILRTDLSGEVVLRWRRGWPLTIELPGSPRAILARPSE